jgi:hypothetical protein
MSRRVVSERARRHSARPMPSRLLSSFAPRPLRGLLGCAVLGSAVTALLVPAGASAAGEPTLSLDQVRPGMTCFARSVVRGTAIDRFDARVVDVVSGAITGEGPRILVRVSGPAIDATGVGPGFSGSPISCPDAAGTPRIIGAISEGIGETANDLVLATPIQAILGEPVSRPATTSARRFAHVRSLAGPWSISGAPAWLEQAMAAGAKRAGRTLLAAPAAPLAAYAPVDLQPGAAMATTYATGDLALGAVGTVAYRDGSSVWGFGHPLADAGARSLFLQDAYVYDLVDLPGFLGGTYKLAAPGHTLGTLTNDTPQAVVGTLASRPRAIPLTVDARDADRGTRTVLREQVADESRLDDPEGASPLRMMAGAITSLAAESALEGAPARQTASVCLRIDVRGHAKPLGFCKREVSEGGIGYQLANDVDRALALVDQNTFARLSLRRVRVRLVLHRGLQQASLRSVRGPKRARPGARVVLRATAHRFRGSRLTLSVPVRIPKGTRPGRTSIVLSGPQATGSSEIDELVVLFDESMSGGQPKAPADSWAELTRRVRGVAGYDGLVARIGGPRAKPVHAFRSPTLRITGTARTSIRIARKR